MTGVCITPGCRESSQFLWCSVPCHDVWVQLAPVGGPVALSWLGETRKPPTTGPTTADGTRVCCDQAAVCHPWPCPWHPLWGGWERPAGAVDPDVYQYAETKVVAS